MRRCVDLVRHQWGREMGGQAGIIATARAFVAHDSLCDAASGSRATPEISEFEPASGASCTLRGGDNLRRIRAAAGLHERVLATVPMQERV